FRARPGPARAPAGSAATPMRPSGSSRSSPSSRRASFRKNLCHSLASRLIKEETERRGRRMTDARRSSLTQPVARFLAGQDAAGLSDGQLLACFAEQGESAALGALIERHGPLVHNVCRRILGPRSEADDAFQATFLVLLRKAASLDRRGSVAPWLHTVA